jgi:hypothetical protein
VPSLQVSYRKISRDLDIHCISNGSGRWTRAAGLEVTHVSYGYRGLAFSHRRMSLNGRGEGGSGWGPFWVLVFVSKPHSSALWKCGNRGSDFQGLSKTRETAVWFSSFCTARHFHNAGSVFFYARRLRILIHNWRLASCMSRAASVSVCAAACSSSAATLSPGRRKPSQPGSSRNISHGVAHR